MSKSALQRPKVRAAAFGYLLDPYLVNKQAIKDGEFLGTTKGPEWYYWVKE